ncbi:MAG TPA: TIGR03667 family PPOX class F420-dependent oxidoreductase [Ktedonobacterales bacterium]|nr:TIGR03667 family PPOX class F420-dependent oxidoreductase [Ktedonobacterales bacterium]
MSSALPDPATDFGQRVMKKLRDERLIWITSVGADGTPQPNPVWFLWDEESFLIYTQPTAARLKHIKRNPRVSLHFETHDDGDDVVIFAGEARVVPDEPLAHEHAAYMAKYKDSMANVSGSAEAMARDYSVAMRVTPTKVRGF